MNQLLAATSAYKILSSDKKRGALSHAYMLVCQDSEMIEDYAVYFAKLMMCKSEKVCDNCRICRLIEKKAHADIEFYPTGSKLTVKDANLVAEHCTIKPFEFDKRLFVLNNFENLAQYQNKLLKTLEEPPENVYLLLTVNSEAAVLPTVKSRVKRLEVGLFTEKQLYDEALKLYGESEKLSLSVMLAGGKMGELKRFYLNEELNALNDLALKVLCEMKKSSEIYKYIGLLKNADLKDFVSLLKLKLHTLLGYKKGAEGFLRIENALKEKADSYSFAAIIALIEKLSGIEKALRFNGNAAMTADSCLFAVLEEKHRWQKLSE